MNEITKILKYSKAIQGLEKVTGKFLRLVQEIVLILPELWISIQKTVENLWNSLKLHRNRSKFWLNLNSCQNFKFLPKIGDILKIFISNCVFFYPKYPNAIQGQVFSKTWIRNCPNVEKWMSTLKYVLFKKYQINLELTLPMSNYTVLCTV